MPSTTIFLPGEVVLIAFPFSDGNQVKLRPAMIVLDTGDEDVVVARITTHRRQTQFDVLLANWQDAGLLAASVVRLHKFATLEKSLISSVLGNLQPSDHANVASAFRRAYGQWLQ